MSDSKALVIEQGFPVVSLTRPQGAGGEEGREPSPLRNDVRPIGPRRHEALVCTKVDVGEIARSRLRQTLDELRANRRSCVLWIEAVERAECINCSVVPETDEQHDDIEVVANGVPGDEEPRLDAREFGHGRHPEPVDDFDLERLDPSQLTDPCLKSIEGAEDQHWPPDPRRAPAGSSLERPENFVKAVAEIDQDVVPIKALPVPEVQRRSSPPHQHSPGKQRLEVPLSSEQALPV